MPTYDYVCLKCEKPFTLSMTLAEHDRKAKCPRCGSTQTEQRFSGFYAKTSKKS